LYSKRDKEINKNGNMKMSYRINLTIEKRKDYEEYLKNYTSEEGEEPYFDFGSRLTELNDELYITQFKEIEQFKEQEYNPYILDKNDFQIILDYYKKFILDNLNHYKTDLNKSPRQYMIWYFEDLLKKKSNIKDVKNVEKEDKNIKSSGLFLLDYFYLVSLFNNLKDDDIIIITHG
jgi:hypothetical protein